MVFMAPLKGVHWPLKSAHRVLFGLVPVAFVGLALVVGLVVLGFVVVVLLLL